MLDEEKRQRRIGGSEVAGIMGLDDFGNDAWGVWAKKKNLLPREEPTFRQVVGKILEQPLLRIYRTITGRETTYLDVTEEDPQHEFMAITPDAVTADGTRGIECKVIFNDQVWRWGPTVNDIPARVQLQCHYYLAATRRRNIEAWDVAALVGGEPRVYSILRDEELEAEILARVEEWWRRYIIGDEKPPITGSRAASRYLSCTFPRERLDLMTPEAEHLEVFRAYEDVRALHARYEKARGDLENQLKLIVGDHQGLRLPGRCRFTWKKTKDGVYVDWESMALALLTNFIKDDAQRKQLLADYTKTKPGSRRIYFRGEEDEVIDVDDAA